MKRALVALLLFAALAGLGALDIMSTEAGGDWDQSSTWIGGQVPGSGDNVTLQGPVLAAYASCASLVVTDRGSLMSKPTQFGQLYVTGLLTNNGTISKNTTTNLNVVIASQMHNAGVFTPSALYLQGTATHYLSGTSPYGPGSLTDSYSGSPLHLSSDVDFENTSIDLQGAYLYLNGHELGVSGGRLYQAAVRCGATSSLTLGGGAWLESVSFIDNSLSLYGEAQLYTNVTFTGINQLVNHSALTNRPGTPFTLNLTGNMQRLDNYGSIANAAGGGTLSVNFSGLHLYNYGTLSGNGFIWNRSGTCYIYQDAAADPISCGSFISTASSAAYQLLSDLAFSNCSIDFNNKTVLMNNGGENYDFSAVNGPTSKVIQRTVFSGSPASFLTVGNTTLNSVTCNVSAVTQETVSLSTGNSFASLTNNGTLSITTGSLSLPVSGTLVNNSGGTITNGSGLFTLTLAGSLYNYGVINNHSFVLNNSAQADLFHSSATPIMCGWFISSGSGGYRLRSDLEFQNCYLDFNLKTVQLHDDDGDYGISLLGSGRYLQDAVLDGAAQSYVNLDGGAYITNVEADQIHFFGNVLIKTGIEIGTLVNYADLTIVDDANYQMLVSTRLENHGTIRDAANYDLTVYITGDIHNAGTLVNRRVAITGTGINNLSQAGSATAFGSYFFEAMKSGGYLQLLSDLSFQNTYVFFNGASLVMHDQNGNYSIAVAGGYFKQASIDGSQACYLNLSGNAWIQDISADALGFTGTVIAANGVNIGSLYNTGTLRDYYSPFTVTVSQLLENYGSIQGALTLSLGGDLFNFGTIANSSVRIGGAQNHSFFHSSGEAIDCDTFTMDVGSGELLLLSDMFFQNCSLNLGGCIVRMYDAWGTHNINLENSLLSAAVLATQGFCGLNLDNNSGLNSVTGQDIVISGTAHIVTGATFANLTLDAGSIVQTNIDAASLYCDGELVNNGTIRDNPSSGAALYLACRGDLYNYGSLINHSVHIANTALLDQYLLLAGTVSNPGGLVLESNIGPAEWYRSGVLQQEGFDQITVSPTVYCVWKPVSTLGEGRRITISNGAPVSPPAGVMVLQDPSIPWLRWDEVQGALYYNVYVSDDPMGDYSLLYGYIFDYALGDGEVYLGISMDTPMKFFKVTAQN